MKLYLCTLLLLCGCASENKPYLPFETKVPVAVLCQTDLPGEPVWYVQSLPDNSSMSRQARAVLADLELSKGYIEQLRAAVSACNAK